MSLATTRTITYHMHQVFRHHLQAEESAQATLVRHARFQHRVLSLVGLAI
jgi:hypothetical protein